MYHRISDHPYFSGVGLEYFETQMAYIKENFRIISALQLADELKKNTLQPYTLALTFDDGYTDFYNNAWPILRKYNLPATLYVPTGFIDRSQWLWPDLIKYILMEAESKKSYLSIDGYKELDDENLMDAWNEFGDHCLKLSAQARDDFIKNFANHFDVICPNEPVKDFSSVTWSQLNEMQSEGLEIGSHSVTHPVLSNLEQADITSELVQSAARIKEMLGKSPSGICYPYGRIQDVSTTVISTAKEQGYNYGVLACNTVLDRNSLYTMGRLAASPRFDDFKWVIAGFERPKNLYWNLS